MINTNDCWLYAGLINTDGYGIIYVKDNDKYLKLRVHRIMYEAYKGEIPQGLILDHLCRVRSCINPNHLETVTDKVNVLRGVGMGALNAKKTHCKQGHSYEDAFITKQGYRKCRQCMRKWRYNNRHKDSKRL